MSRVKLGDVAREHKETIKGDKSNYPIVGLEHLIPENIRLTQWDYNKENTFTKVFRKGCVLFGRRRAYLKKAVYADFDGICSGDITVIEAIPGKILPELLPFVIQNDDLFDYAVGKSAGSLSPRVKWEHLKNYEFELPDIERQHELAKILWSIVETKESYERLMAATDELVKSQFIELFENKKTEKIQLRSIALEWMKGQAFKKDDIVEDGKSRCIHYGELFTCYGSVINTVRSSTNVIPIRTSKIGDILFPASDVTPLGLTKCSAIMLNDVILGGDIIIMRPKEGVNPEYLSYAIRMQKEQLLSRVTGTVVRHISGKSLQTVNIPLPNVEKQNQFAEFVCQSDKSKFQVGGMAA